MPKSQPSQIDQPSNPLLLILIVFGAWMWWTSGDKPGPPVPPDDDTTADVLATAYDRDRATQVTVLRELAQQPFDGATDEGRKAAGEWYNKNRFRNRADDFGDFTDAVAESIANNSENELATKLEGSK
jgi:hypothetical protein